MKNLFKKKLMVFETFLSKSGNSIWGEFQCGKKVAFFCNVFAKMGEYSKTFIHCFKQKGIKKNVPTLRKKRRVGTNCTRGVENTMSRYKMYRINKKDRGLVQNVPTIHLKNRAGTKS
ncbi:hypothetical protein EGI32_17015 [Ferruginibacter sp. HRS2-29]|nr:hypothetical protein [Ferruginibacter sp. HRS2-29]MCP9751553.1 hypothetical protein [Ferruginibacter sp. HRS2-29]MCP9752656.1 hypothetical protein [Ferruginibacter sp. HRS2-29]